MWLNPKLRLVVLSFLMLFVELALIRWTGSNVVYLSYFSNFVLLGSFLGIGVGFLRARARTNLFRWSPLGLAALVLYVDRFPVKIDRSGTDLIFFGEFSATGLPLWATLPIVFVSVAVVMAMITEGVARQFVKFEPLEAYRLDILGSIAGIAGFSILSFAHAPPVAWGIIVTLTYVVLLFPQPGFTKGAPRRATARLAVAGIALVAIVGTLYQESTAPDTSWSPYYKVELTYFRSDFIDIHVNGIPHQRMMPTQQRLDSEPFYFYPYEHRSDPEPPESMLIVGAGTGSDVAIALQQGVAHIDAVEIDPRLQELGEELHPDRPYDSANVSVTINDGRAFLEQTDRTYDMILFALPDSLTLVSGQSSLRLESYLFTQEAMESVRDRLAPDGVYAMYNYYREPWLVDRLANTLEVVFGHAPCVDAIGGAGSGLAVLAASVDPAALDCPTRWTAADPPVSDPPTDDHPFLYLRNPGIPSFFLLTIGLILGVSLIMVRAAGGPFSGMRNYVDLFFMGVAFLLLETKSVVQFALLFGTTWFVNALVFGGILTSVWLAVEVARRVRPQHPQRMYVYLVLALLVAWLVPVSALVGLAAPLRFAAATALAFTPIFIANLVFAERFRDTGDSTTAFGANLLGAMVGGLLEYTSLVMGYRNLLIVTAFLYGLAFFAGRKFLRSG